MVTCKYQHPINEHLTKCKSPDKCEYAHRYSAGMLKYCEKDKRMLEATRRFQEESSKLIKNCINDMLGEGV